MVFFNYSTMQMAAKVVYYGPGLCGKTTNLSWIFNHTASGSRGEMVSLETETDRTLFFDLLPIDIGKIAGFQTRLQLYTVPGQVFYNTTRKLVLKGVDGVVFVADSQRPMLQANLDSFRNLEENLQDMGLTVDSLPLVLQYNKRDLADILPVEELNKSLNRKDWAWFEASAVNGDGVFDTLKGVSKLTLLSLKQRLGRQDAPAPAPRPSTARPAPVLQGEAAAKGAAPVAVSQVQVQGPAPGAEAAAAAPAARSTPAPAAKPAAPAPKAPETQPADAASKAARSRSRSLDAMGELERLRQSAMKGSRSAAPRAKAKSPAAAASTNGKGQLFRDIQLTLKRADFLRARRFSVSLQVEDEDRKVMDAVRDFEVELEDVPDRTKVSLNLNIALNSKD